MKHFFARWNIILLWTAFECFSRVLQCGRDVTSDVVVTTNLQCNLVWDGPTTTLTSSSGPELGKPSISVLSFRFVVLIRCPGNWCIPLCMSNSHLDHLCMHKCMSAFIQTHTTKSATQLRPAAGVCGRCVLVCWVARGCWQARWLEKADGSSLDYGISACVRQTLD